MEPETISFIQQVQGLSVPAAFVAVAFILYKAGILNAITSWLNKIPGGDRIKKLEDFQYSAENNHWHDLEFLLKDREELWEVVRKMQSDVSQIRADVANINGRLGNGHR